MEFTTSGSESLHGIPVKRFVLSASNFDNSSCKAENACYNNNIPTGVQNVTQCKAKSPTFVSRPHFHLADPYYKEQFQFGIMESENFGSHILIEPLSSIPIRVDMKLQLNILLNKVEGIEYLFKNLQYVMFPVMWFESTAELPEEMAASLKMLVMIPDMMLGCGVFSVILGSVIISFVIRKLIRRWSNDEKPTLECDYQIVTNK